MRFSSIILFLFIYYVTYAQQPTSKIHSHNDYVQEKPFWNAWQHQAGSIEADIFWDSTQNRIWVAHTRTELLQNPRTLEDLYLIPLSKCIVDNNGSVYKNPKQRLQLMIDIKTESKTSLQALITLLNKYESVIKCTSLSIVISGNRPPANQYHLYPSYILFDGELGEKYSKVALQKIAMLSGNFSKWIKDKSLNDKKEYDTLKKLIRTSRSLGKPTRLWNAPDHPEIWNKLLKLKLGYINTDKVADLATYLQNQ